MIFCRQRCNEPGSWGGEIRLTETSFDYAKAPVAGGPFIGDYLGLAAHGGRVVSFFPQTVSDRDPSSMFARTIELESGFHGRHGRKYVGRKVRREDR